MSWGAVNDLKVVDMMEDDAGDYDILAALTTATNMGSIKLWHNENGTLGVPDTTGHSFEPDEMPMLMEDEVFADGEVLCMTILDFNNDVFPDLAFGTRNSNVYTGNAFLLAAYGTLPAFGTRINRIEQGEVVSIETADFNKDNRADIVVGTRSTATQGRLVAFFGQE